MLSLPQRTSQLHCDNAQQEPSGDEQPHLQPHLDLHVLVRKSDSAAEQPYSEVE